MLLRSRGLVKLHGRNNVDGESALAVHVHDTEAHLSSSDVARSSTTEPLEHERAVPRRAAVAISDADGQHVLRRKVAALSSGANRVNGRLFEPPPDTDLLRSNVAERATACRDDAGGC